jgi:putative transposase
MVLDHEGEHPSRWATISSIAGKKISCSPHTLLEWVKKADRDSGRSPGVPSDVAAKLKALERENRELRQANEDPTQGVGLFCPGGARPPVQAMIAFIDDHRAAYGVEPICKVLPIAPSMSMQPSGPIRRSCPPGQSGMCLLRRRSGVCLPRISRSTGCARSGGN